MYVPVAAITVLIILLLYHIGRKSDSPEKKSIPPENGLCENGGICNCGTGDICEKQLWKLNAAIIYFEDEELDRFKHKPDNRYGEDEIDMFRDVLYTLQQNEIEEWLTSLEKREIELPDVLKQEVLDMML